MKQLTHQTQPSYDTCVCTCVAMITGKDARDVIESHHARYTNYEVSVGRILTLEDVPHDDREPCDEMSLGRHIIFVPSLNVPRMMHAVILDVLDEGTRVWDPSKGFMDGSYESAYYVGSLDEPNHKGFELLSGVMVATVFYSTM